MIGMKRLTIVIGAVTWILLSGGTQAQIIPPGGSKFNPPLPLPPPPPKIEVPVVPQMDAPPRQSMQAPHPSFSDKITNCLQEGAANGLGPSDREEYSRSCANSR
jgi:hypothetical protein